MDKQEIIEGNRVICIFDGWTIEPGMEKEPDPYYNRGFNMQMLSEMGYHKDWNWIMTIVEKIEALGYDTNIFTDEDGCQFMIWKQGLSYKRKQEDLIIENIPAKRTNKIGVVWKAVIFFIKWLNSQKQ